MSGRATLLALLCACAPAATLVDDMPEDVAMALVDCRLLEGEQQDWCTLQAVGSSLGTGLDDYELCRRMGAALPRDLCLEASVRHSDQPAPYQACDSVQDPAVRQMCWVSAAETHAAQDLQGAIALCRRANTVVERCVARVIAWHARQRPDSFEVLTQDVRTALEVYPRLAYDSTLGASVGKSARSLGAMPGREGPCAAFPPGQARLTCTGSLSY